MKAENINTIDDAQRFLEGVLNDFEMGLSDKKETMYQLFLYTLRLNELHNKQIGTAEKLLK